MNNNRQLARSDIDIMLISSLQAVLSDTETSLSHSLGESTCLIGHQSVVDSLALVRLLADLEQRLTDEYGFSVTLADERAMSQKNSPFRTVRSLADYICLLTQEARRNGGA